MPAAVKARLAVNRRLFEQRAQTAGYRVVGGVDEAGRGPLAGPVVAACVVLPDRFIGEEQLDDSKKLTPAKRRELFLLIHEQAREVGVGVIDSQTIDRVNILQATFLAMQRAVDSLNQAPDFLLIDGNRKPGWVGPSEMLVGGEARSLSIAAASIVAKETRDRIMKDYEQLYPHWGFARHKGYGTAAHLAAIQAHGVCDIHRRSYAPIQNLEARTDQV